MIIVIPLLLNPEKMLEECEEEFWQFVFSGYFYLLPYNLKGLNIYKRQVTRSGIIARWIYNSFVVFKYIREYIINR